MKVGDIVEWTLPTPPSVSLYWRDWWGLGLIVATGKDCKQETPRPFEGMNEVANTLGKFLELPINPSVADIPTDKVVEIMWSNGELRRHSILELDLHESG